MSAVSICNDAILACGSSKFIKELTEATTEARLCNQVYDKARIATLEDFDWTFAKGREPLAVSAEDPPDEWAFRYAPPTNSVKMRGLVNPLGDDAPPVPYDIELLDDGTSKSVLTNLEDAVMRFTRDITNPAQFSQLFRDALALQIAARICYALTAKRELASDISKSYSVILRKAQASDSGERGQREAPDAPWVAGR